MQIIILGGGIAGLTAAALLAQNLNLDIVLVESKQPNFAWDNNTYDIRCSAIARSSQQVFRHLGVWSKICAQRVGMYRQMYLWSSDSSDNFQFDAEDIGQSDLGHIIENRIIQRTLWELLSVQKNVTIKFGTAQHLEYRSDKVCLYVDNECVEADLIIGADGADSWLRNAAKIQVHSYADQQQALVATMSSQLPHVNIARQRFTKDGPLAFLPLDQPNLSSIVWSGSKPKIAELMELEAPDFCAYLEREFNHALGTLNLHGKRACFPLRMQHAQSYIASRIALIGDAAHVVHPLAGQGLNLGILDAAALSEVIHCAIQDNKNIGALPVLRKYERWRKVHNLSMLSIVDAFNRPYAMHAPLLQILRDTGLQVVNNFKSVKSVMMRYAMGLSGDLPECAQSPIFVGLK